VLIIEPKVFNDPRGFFMEVYQFEQFKAAGIGHHFVQDNHSHSQKGTLRGLHYQISHVQGKLIRVTCGEIFDVAVDVRKSSPTFGKWVGANLSSENKNQFWIPSGFAHGYYTLSGEADVIYKTSDYYDPEGERCILWNDSTLAIDWPLLPGVEPILSEKDKCGKLFSEAEVLA